MIIGERMSKRRKDLQMTQDDLANLLGVNRRQIARYETEDNNPTSEILVAIAKELNVSIDWLLGLTDVLREHTSQSDLDAREKRLVELYRSKSPEAQDKLMEMAKII